MPRRVLWMVGVVLGAYLTARMSIVAVIGVLVALDAGILAYWFYFRARRVVPATQASRHAPMRSLAEVLRVAGVLLIANALWLTILGVLTEFGITNPTTADWSGLATAGFQVRADQPVAFGARCLVVGASVWAVGFGLTKASFDGR